jgi:hypothetical protein
VRQFPPDIHFTHVELTLRPEDLLKLLKNQMRRALEDGGELRREEIYELEERRKKEWNAKELVLENMLDGEADRTLRRAAPGTDRRLCRWCGAFPRPA